jgi:hypothetical protein
MGFVILLALCFVIPPLIPLWVVLMIIYIVGGWLGSRKS